MKTYGTLFAIGVGPGEPDLLTLKAVKVLQTTTTVFCACSSKNDESLAYSIAQEHLPKHAETVLLNYPMTHDKEALSSAWTLNANTILKALETGQNAAFLTLGDPLTYSTFGYTLPILREIAPSIPIEIIPGITSYQSAAAKTETILVESRERLSVISGIADRQALANDLAATDAAVILKAYKNFEVIRSVLDEFGLLPHSTMVSKCGLEGELITRDLASVTETPPYFTLILVRKPKK